MELKAAPQPEPGANDTEGTQVRLPAPPAPPASILRSGRRPAGRSHGGQSRPAAAGSAPPVPGACGAAWPRPDLLRSERLARVGCAAVRQRGPKLPEFGAGGAVGQAGSRRWAGAARAYVREGEKEGGQRSPPPLGPSLPEGTGPCGDGAVLRGEPAAVSCVLCLRRLGFCGGVEGCVVP